MYLRYWRSLDRTLWDRTVWVSTSVSLGSPSWQTRATLWDEDTRSEGCGLLVCARPLFGRVALMIASARPR